ncbi:MAG: hypothetical protein C0518_04710 [Opitutus sp.]|nr:hypothetical protein [Opitutus sp.]
MTMKTKSLICLGALLGVAAVKTQFELPLAKVTVRVLDEAQRPLPGAQVSLGFKNRLTSDDVFVRGQTDADGRFTGEGGAGPTGVSNEITHEGYYQGWAPIPKFYEIDPLNHWKPWDQTYTTTLRRIGKPVPLLAKTLRKLEIPALGQSCGYDLEAGDWVAPWGKGKTSDFVFKATRDYRDWFNFAVEVELEFTQPKDGLLSMTWAEHGKHSSFRWERSAPETGYARPHLIRFINRDPRSGEHPTLTFDSSAKDKGYFFRVRTVEKNGQIIAANYGKIVGDIGIEARDTKTCIIYFTYYLNPTSLDRNMEWDPTRNLLSGLSWEENPREP